MHLSTSRSPRSIEKQGYALQDSRNCLVCVHQVEGTSKAKLLLLSSYSSHRHRTALVQQIGIHAVKMTQTISDRGRFQTDKQLLAPPNRHKSERRSPELMLIEFEGSTLKRYHHAVCRSSERGTCSQPLWNILSLCTVYHRIAELRHRWRTILVLIHRLELLSRVPVKLLANMPTKT